MLDKLKSSSLNTFFFKIFTAICNFITNKFNEFLFVFILITRKHHFTSKVSLLNLKSLSFDSFKWKKIDVAKNQRQIIDLFDNISFITYFYRGIENKLKIWFQISLIKVILINLKFISNLFLFWKNFPFELW